MPNLLGKTLCGPEFSLRLEDYGYSATPTVVEVNQNGNMTTTTTTTKTSSTSISFNESLKVTKLTRTGKVFLRAQNNNSSLSKYSSVL